MDILGRIFGTEKALESAVQGVRDGLDALIFTDEERATEAAKDRSEARKLVVQWMEATQGQNLSRRLISLSITATWLSGYVISGLTRAIAVFVDDAGTVTAAKVSAVSEIAWKASVDMNGAVMLILAFYFAAPHMGDIAKAALSRFSSTAKPRD